MSTSSLATAGADWLPARAGRERHQDESSLNGPFYRPRLVHWLQVRAERASIVILQAPAGYGKTEVLNLWCAGLRESGAPVIRIDLTPADSGPAQFQQRLQRELEASAPGTMVSLCVDEEQSRLAPDSLSMLFELALVQRVRVLVASRRNITQGLARSRAQGQVAVLEAQEIALDRSEVRAVFEAEGIAVDDPTLDAVMSHTDGWPPAVRLLAVPAQETSPAARAALLAGRSVIADFFAEEVLSALPETLRAFLQSVAILERLHPALCDAVTCDRHAQECLEQLSRDGHFVSRIDDGAGWYQLHPLFGAYLRGAGASVGVEERRLQHLRAFEWFDREGLFVEAFDHAMHAGEPERAARVFHAHAGDFYMSGLETSIVPTASRLPASVRDRFPRIMLAMSWRLMAEFRFGLASALLEAAEVRIREICGEGTVMTVEGRELEQDVRHCRVMQLMFREDFAALDREAATLMQAIEHQRNPYMVMSLYAAMMYSQREQFRLGSHERLEALAREHLHAIPSRYMHVLFESMVAPGRLLQGQTDAVIELLQKALEVAIEMTGRSSPVPATVALTLAEALYCQNEIPRASELLDEYLPYATDAGFVDQLISGYLTKARIERLRGNEAGALATLQAAESFAAERGFQRLGTMALSERVTLLCRLDRTEEAVRLGQWHHLRLSSPPAAPGKRSTRADNARALAWARLAQASGQIAEAQAVAKLWRSHASAAKAIATVLDWDLLRAQLLLASNEDTAARRLILQSLALAAPSGRIRTFVDEAGRLLPVYESLAASPPVGSAFESFAAAVLRVIQHECGNSTPDAHVPDLRQEVAVADLTARELAIVKLAAAGHMNAEIGTRLGLTAGTVKWYLHQVYRKLGCRRRIKAIEHVRRLGLI